MVEKAVVEYLELSAGMGKTYSTLKWLVEEEIPKGNKWVYVGKGKALANASERDVLGFNPDITTEVIHSDSKYLSTVTASVVDCLNEEDKVDILFITHNSFISLVRESPDVFSGWNLLIDEMLDVFDTQSYSKDIATDMLEEYLVPCNGSEVFYTLDAPSGVIDSWERDHRYMNVSSFSDFISCLRKGHVVTFKNEGKNKRSYVTYDLLDVTGVFSCVGRVVMLGARIKDTLHCNFMERQGVVFTPFLCAKPRCTSYGNQGRVSIYYLTSEDSPHGCTGGLLDTAYNPSNHTKVTKASYLKLPNGIDDLDDGYLLVYQAYVERACELLGEEFIYTVNKVYPNSPLYKPVKYKGRDVGTVVPYGCHGLNHLKSHTKVLSLFCVKPSPSQLQLFTYLQEQLQYPCLTEDYVDEKFKEFSYQLCTRSKLRDVSDTSTPVTFVVPDIDVARYIKEHHIPDCVIKDDLAMLIPYDRGGHNRGFAEEYFSGDTSGKRAYHREVEKHKRLHDGKEPSVDYLIAWKDKFLAKRERIENGKIDRM